MFCYFLLWFMFVILGVIDRICNIVFEKGLFFLMGDLMFQSFICVFLNLQYVFFLVKYNYCEVRNLFWCVDLSVNYYILISEEEVEIQYGRRGYEIKNFVEYCWVWFNVEKCVVEVRRVLVVDVRFIFVDEVNGISNIRSLGVVEEEFFIIIFEEIVCYVVDDMCGLDDFDFDLDLDEVEELGIYVQ